MITVPLNFGRPNAETGCKMANGRLLFLALVDIDVHVLSHLKEEMAWAVDTYMALGY